MMRRIALGLTLCLGLQGCVSVPEGRFACGMGEPCPRGQACDPYESICYPATEVVGGDASVPDAESDVAMIEVGADGGDGDAGPLDSGTEPDCTESALDPATEQEAIFVSLGGSLVANCGTPTEPCKTIALGIKNAVLSRRSKIIIAAGTYAELEPVTLSPGLVLQGGWSHIGDRFARQCSAARAASVVIASRGTKGVVASYEGTATLDTLTVRGTAPAAGESRYALFVTGAATELVLNDVHAEAVSAGSGAPGEPGAAGAMGVGTCAAGTGAAGALGSPGASAAAGTFGPDGYAAASAVAGGAGGNGAAGKPLGPRCAKCLAEGATCKVDGRSCVATATTAAESCGKPGLTGCAGAGGVGGTAGKNGGSSVALFVVDSKVTITGGALRAGNGGAGGAGGAGGGGGKGALGSTGAAGDVCRVCPVSPFRFGTINVCLISATGVAGIPNGQGGDGGDGGRGGDGAAGSSFAIYSIRGTVTPSAETQLVAGQPGAAAGSGAPGQAGIRGGPGG